MFGRFCANLTLSGLSSPKVLAANPATQIQRILVESARRWATSATGTPAQSQEQDNISKAFQSHGPAVHNTPSDPWTPTDQLKKRKHLTKRMGHLLQVLEQEQMDLNARVKTFPRFAAGDFLEIKTAVPENQRREAIFKGLCIARKWRGWRSTFTVRNFITGGGGIERTFQLYTPHILQIKVIKSMQTRRAKLYYMRKRQPREYRV
ncbi:hypothetical protein WJX84_011327 [Apatococcus fuscideae]|uniref:Ribosomal protein L19 n=1 Tax=Apatococcus fuscideae TaxID=2026836 RepID=A0AAW1TE04_9CHLO